MLIGCTGVILPSSGGWAASFSGMSPVKVMLFDHTALTPMQKKIAADFSERVVRSCSDLTCRELDLLRVSVAYIPAIRLCPVFYVQEKKVQAAIDDPIKVVDEHVVTLVENIFFSDWRCAAYGHSKARECVNAIIASWERLRVDLVQDYLLE
ncbi:MAG: hypothetical protein QG604_909 [Candidatus Dependentiae bacterium]|nr:hypothetical protein [Candidatus Dependentiae bacterium]